MQEIKHFKNKEEAIKYGREANFGKYDFEKIVIENYEDIFGADTEIIHKEIAHNQTVILCGTDIPYETEFYSFAYQMIDRFDLDEDESNCLRDEFIDTFERYCNVRFLDVYDRY